MPDIHLRFHNDMLVLSSPIDVTLARQGIDVERDRQYLNLMEPDVITDALRLENMAGAQCLVATTVDLTQARLAHVRMDGDAKRLAHEAVQIAAQLKPQHILAEIGPCGLPLDVSSKASLNENRKQYADAARALDDEPIDALFLNGFTNLGDLKCALMGVGQITAKPVFASVSIGEAPLEPAPKAAVGTAPADKVLENMPSSSFFGGFELADAPGGSTASYRRTPLSPELWDEAVAVMQDLGAAVIGFETADPTFKATAYAERARKITDRPLLAQLRVTADPQAKPKAPLKPLEDILDYTPDTMAPAAVKLYGAGVQFLRATGNATPSYTGALAATVHGLDVHKS